MLFSPGEREGLGTFYIYSTNVHERDKQIFPVISPEIFAGENCVHLTDISVTTDY